MKAWLIIGMLAVGLNQSVPKQADKSQTNQHADKRVPSQPARAAAEPRLPLPAPSSEQEENSTNGKAEQTSWGEKLLSPVIGNWPLILIAVWGILVARGTLKVIARQAVSMRRQTRVLRKSVNAQIASERAWIDGELAVPPVPVGGPSHLFLLARNLGKTPGEIRSYRINAGPLIEGTHFSPDRLPQERTKTLHIFLESGKDKRLEEINLAEMFPNVTEGGDRPLGKGALCVTITYADVVTGTPENRPQHETSLVYIYTPLLQHAERLSQYNRYT